MDFLAEEREGLMAAPGVGGRSQGPDWDRYGLSSKQQQEADAERLANADESYQHHHEPSHKNELFAQDQSSASKPWWISNFFISEPVLFGTWDGVFTSCMINIFGVIIFLRTGWMVGNAGIGLSILIILMTITVALIAALSVIGVCERCKIERGGVYFLLSHVLGARIGASVGIIYCFGQAIACSLYTVGFGESIANLINEENPWVARGIAIGVVLMLLVINVAGVKWVIRLQLILLMILFIAVLDFLVGSFVHTDWRHGETGYRLENLQNNTGPSYMEGESFFTVFGVFFPTATGVFAGINMSGDLRNPSKSIPLGTLSAVGVSTFLYLSFATVLGATCIRDILQTDYMIAERVAWTGALFLAGLYISSVSSCMGSLYGAPRILQTIAQDGALPFMKFLGHGVAVTDFLWLTGLYMVSLSSALGCYSGTASILQVIAFDLKIKYFIWLGVEFKQKKRGANQVPVYALMVITTISLIFILVGQVNTLAPIVTMPFILTYATVDYSYFALAMSFDRRKAREDRFKGAQQECLPATFDTTNKLNGNLPPTGPTSYGSFGRKRGETQDDLDNLFPERRHHEGRNLQRHPSGGSLGKTDLSQDDPLIDPSKAETMSMTSDVEASDTAGLLEQKPQPINTSITHQPRSFYSLFCNRWLSLLGALVSLIIMFSIQWGYALACITLALVIYIYISQANPGTFPGIAEFSLWEWVRDGVRRCCHGGSLPPEQIVVTPNTPAMNTMAAQLTEDNEDFANRGRYHQSEIVKGNDFDDLDSE